MEAPLKIRHIFPQHINQPIAHHVSQGSGNSQRPCAVPDSLHGQHLLKLLPGHSHRLHHGKFLPSCQNAGNCGINQIENPYQRKNRSQKPSYNGKHSYFLGKFLPQIFLGCQHQICMPGFNPSVNRFYYLFVRSFLYIQKRVKTAFYIAKLFKILFTKKHHSITKRAATGACRVGKRRHCHNLQFLFHALPFFQTFQSDFFSYAAGRPSCKIIFEQNRITSLVKFFLIKVPLQYIDIRKQVVLHPVGMRINFPALFYFIQHLFHIAAILRHLLGFKKGNIIFGQLFR